MIKQNNDDTYILIMVIKFIIYAEVLFTFVWIDVYGIKASTS